MALESWLASSFSHLAVAVTDSPGLQAAIAARLVAVGWTNPSANVYKSPDTVRWIQLTFSQPDSAKLNIVLIDYLGRTATNARRVGVVGNPSTWQIHANRFGLNLWSSTSSGWYFCGIVDHFPKSYTSHNLDVYVGGEHDTLNAASGDTIESYQMIREDGTWTAEIRMDVGNQTVLHVDASVSGVRRDKPHMAWVRTSNGLCYAGRWHHAVTVPFVMTKDAEFSVPVDQDVVATFKVTGFPYLGGTSYIRDIAVRVS